MRFLRFLFRSLNNKTLRHCGLFFVAAHLLLALSTGPFYLLAVFLWFFDDPCICCGRSLYYLFIILSFTRLHYTLTLTTSQSPMSITSLLSFSMYALMIPFFYLSPQSPLLQIHPVNVTLKRHLVLQLGNAMSECLSHIFGRAFVWHNS